MRRVAHSRALACANENVRGTRNKISSISRFPSLISPDRIKSLGAPERSKARKNKHIPRAIPRALAPTPMYTALFSLSLSSHRRRRPLRLPPTHPLTLLYTRSWDSRRTCLLKLVKSALAPYTRFLSRSLRAHFPSPLASLIPSLPRGRAHSHLSLAFASLPLSAPSFFPFSLPRALAQAFLFRLLTQ